MYNIKIKRESRMEIKGVTFVFKKDMTINNHVIVDLVNNFDNEKEEKKGLYIIIGDIAYYAYQRVNNEEIILKDIYIKTEEDIKDEKKFI